jgi:holo-[acyl-carrier protein] synthase
MLEKIGMGTDIVDIKRFEDKPFENNISFYKKLFHESEIKYCLDHTNSAQHFAAKFAIKESVIKSLNKKIEFLNILINYYNSKPTVTLIDDSSYSFLVSVSHEKLYSIAVVLCEKI